MSQESQYAPFNPLDRVNLAASVGEALLEREPVPLDAVPDVVGAGVYVIYYCGDFPSYAPLSDANSNGEWKAPIYVGKAIPKGGRKGGLNVNTKPGKDLKNRLREHRDSIVAAENLSLEHFSCRFLTVEDIWIPLGENLMITIFSPLWNSTIDGFGNHTPGKGRFNQKRSRWDVLHPGREWAAKCQPRPETAEMIASDAEEHLRSRPVEATNLSLFRALQSTASS